MKGDLFFMATLEFSFLQWIKLSNGTNQLRFTNKAFWASGHSLTQNWHLGFGNGGDNYILLAFILVKGTTEDYEVKVVTLSTYMASIMPTWMRPCWLRHFTQAQK